MKLYDLCVEYEAKWQEVKDQYPPDPAMDEAYTQMLSVMEMVGALEKITKRQYDPQ